MLSSPVLSVCPICSNRPVYKIVTTHSILVATVSDLHNLHHILPLRVPRIRPFGLCRKPTNYLYFSWYSLRTDLAQRSASACTRNHNTEKCERNIH